MGGFQWRSEPVHPGPRRLSPYPPGADGPPPSGGGPSVLLIGSPTLLWIAARAVCDISESPAPWVQSLEKCGQGDPPQGNMRCYAPALQVSSGGHFGNECCGAVQEPQFRRSEIGCNSIRHGIRATRSPGGAAGLLQEDRPLLREPGRIHRPACAWIGHGVRGREVGPLAHARGSGTGAWAVRWVHLLRPGGARRGSGTASGTHRRRSLA